MRISGIYIIRSKRNPERIYIGSSANIYGRWQTHLCALRKNTHHSIKLQRHYNKYAVSDLQFSVLIECPKEDLITQEQGFINLLNPYFNICKIAGSNLGCKHPHSEETRNQIGKSNIGKHNRICSEETKNLIKEKRKLQVSNKGYHHTEESKQNMRVPHKCGPMSEENRQIRRKSHGPMSEEHKQNLRIAYCINKNLNLL